MAHAAGLAGIRQARQHRHLLHRRAPVPGVPEPPSAHRAPARSRQPTGESLGEHAGLAFYTLGQRSGLEIGGRAGAAAAPWYVADKDSARNALIVVQDQRSPAAAVGRLRASSRCTGSSRSATAPGEIDCAVKTRYRQSDLACARARARRRGPCARGAAIGPRARSRPGSTRCSTAASAVSAAASSRGAAIHALRAARRAQNHL